MNKEAARECLHNVLRQMGLDPEDWKIVFELKQKSGPTEDVWPDDVSSDGESDALYSKRS